MIQYDTIQVVVCFYARKTAEFGRAFMCAVRTYLNLSQLLQLLGTEAKYVRENTDCRYFVPSCTCSISGLYCSMQQILRVLYVSRGAVLMRVLQVYFRVFRPLVRTASARSVPKYSQYAQ